MQGRNGLAKLLLVLFRARFARTVLLWIIKPIRMRGWHDKAARTHVTVSFRLDAIASMAWKGFGSSLAAIWKQIDSFNTSRVWLVAVLIAHINKLHTVRKNWLNLANRKGKCDLKIIQRKSYFCRLLLYSIDINKHHLLYQNFVFFTEWRQSCRVCLIQRQNSRYFRCPVLKMKSSF